ncbi:class I SAM-dependent methyltransferase [Conexibacter woesei]|uniref:Methyltransferase type 12 n=1 Tax=Conexibacter woesei (strain DSM 14684 / CCUG 47730 / CIP 108061 / JCM 11494 / NBRC 100937 / ID131577) TaxID=469383 RepID=D3F3C6_CONWI|nr:class I SAM-dependent methyltransferase [Conexibacter woesei]ADB50406.1 Methyltransferase type 12 [Conexibacter woesei DSM 14684]
MAIPERLTRAVELIGVGPEQRILEIGCGPGVAAALICERLSEGSGGGHLTAIDRSETAIARASRRNAGHVAAGTVDFRRSDLAALALDGARFDTVFAVNVNLFWVGDASAELGLLRDALVPGGRLHLFYEGPSPGKDGRIADAIVPALAAHGFTATSTTVPPLLWIAATAPSPGQAA